MPRPHTLAGSLIGALAVSACALASGDSDPSLSRFQEGSPGFARVVENNTSCTVDAVCFLRLEFADTTVVAVYGTGERPAPPCTMTVEVSDAAFPIERGEVIEAVVSPCGSEGYFLERVRR